MSGWKLPGYVVEDLVGFGGSGDVWRARVASSGEPVALKRVRLSDPDRLRTVHTEAALLTALDHPHLIRLHELIPTGDSVVLVLDLAQGGTLAELLDTRGTITPGEAVTALAPVGAALAYAHNAGVVHGDVTPSNILFTEAGRPLLADLGVARLLDDDAPVHSTPAFIDPAVAVGCVPGPQSDVFMLGAVTFRALTGHSIWPGDTAAEVLAAAAAGEIGEVDGPLAAAAVPEAMRTVVTRALSVDPAHRGTAAEFALDFRHAATPVGVELSAGRQRTAPTPAGPPDAASADAPRASRADSPDSARPPFDRPRGGAPATPAAVLTHQVRARPRPIPARSRHRAPGTKARAARWVGAAAVGVLALGALVVWTAFGRAEPSKAARQRSSSAARSGPTTGAAPASASAAPRSASGAAASPAAPAVIALDARAVRAVLIRLDQLREQAFAVRDPRLLGNVYATGPLLTQDSSLLTRLVPDGCRLVGVHTTYDHVQVIASGAGGLHVAVRAALAESRLVCGANATGRAGGSGPTTLHIELTRHGSGYLIAGITR